MTSEEQLILGLIGGAGTEGGGWVRVEGGWRGRGDGMIYGKRPPGGSGTKSSTKKGKKKTKGNS